MIGITKISSTLEIYIFHPILLNFADKRIFSIFFFSLVKLVMSEQTTLLVLVGAAFFILILFLIPWGGKGCECYDTGADSESTVNRPKYNPEEPNPPPMFRNATVTSTSATPNSMSSQVALPRAMTEQSSLKPTSMYPYQETLVAPGDISKTIITSSLQAPSPTTFNNPFFGGFPGEVQNGISTPISTSTNMSQTATSSEAASVWKTIL